MEKPKLELENLNSYMDSTLVNFKWQLKKYFGEIKDKDLTHVHEHISKINTYENVDHLRPITENQVIILDEDEIDPKKAEDVILAGEFFWEHAAAGEATRLGLGTKYLLNLKDLPISKIKEMMEEEAQKDSKGDPEKLQKLMQNVTEEKIREVAMCEPELLLDINLGTRHMLQMVFDIKKLCEDRRVDFTEVLGRQKVLTILNETTAETILSEWQQYNLFGLNRKNVFFMIQRSFPGITMSEGDIMYDESHKKHYRLHNHGQMAMQKTHDDEVFRLSSDGSKEFLSSAEFESVLNSTKDMVSFNIEDIKYLTSSIDWHSLSLALELGEKDYGMVMEIVAQNPHKPQKGGACFWDDKKQRVVMIESNQLPNIDVSDITHLNKNFNHYPNPVVAYRALREGDINLHSDVKEMPGADGEKQKYLYFCTPQGDINFLVKTAYVMRRVLKPIANWKSAATTAPTVKACYDQDRQEGFKEFAEGILGKKL